MNTIIVGVLVMLILAISFHLISRDAEARQKKFEDGIRYIQG